MCYIFYRLKPEEKIAYCVIPYVIKQNFALINFQLTGISIIRRTKFQFLTKLFSHGIFCGDRYAPCLRTILWSILLTVASLIATLILFVTLPRILSKDATLELRQTPFKDAQIPAKIFVCESIGYYKGNRFIENFADDF